MDAREISYDDLVLDDEGSGTATPTSVEQLLADGFPRGGGLEALEAIAQLEAQGARQAALAGQVRQLLQEQRAARRR